jgi:hypothetical protein
VQLPKGRGFPAAAVPIEEGPWKMGTPLYDRMLAYDYGDQERADLMREVWEGTPFMTNCNSGSIASDREREINDWCREHFGDEAWPIHGRPGNWQRGGATVYGWTWYGFRTAEMLKQFEAAWECKDEN